MFGLPAAALAIWQTAKPENRLKVGGIMASGALTAFLTGITEPLECTFLFAAPALYFVHAVLVGTAFAAVNLAGAHIGYTFSQGAIDFGLFYALDTKPWLVFVLGPVYAVVYYAVFRFFITAFDMKTPGRDDDATAEDAPDDDGRGAKTPTAARVGAAFGGRDNIQNLDACITLLRLILKDPAKARDSELKALGATGLMRVGNGVQAVFGMMSENLKTEMEEFLRSGVDVPVISAPALSDGVRTALGGEANIKSTESEADGGVCVRLGDPSLIDEDELRASGVTLMFKINGDQAYLSFS